MHTMGLFKPLIFDVDSKQVETMKIIPIELVNQIHRKTHNGQLHENLILF